MTETTTNVVALRRGSRFDKAKTEGAFQASIALAVAVSNEAANANQEAKEHLQFALATEGDEREGHMVRARDCFVRAMDALIEVEQGLQA